MKKIKGRVLIIGVGLGLISVALFITFLTDIVRARIIDIDRVVKQLTEQTKAQTFNPQIIPKIAVERGFDYDKGLDSKCVFWSAHLLNSGWTGNANDHDFFIDYYVPPDKKAIICTTPALAGALTAEADKPFLYEVFPTDYGLRVRITVGVSQIRRGCEKVTGNINCANSILSRQAIVRFEP